MSASLLERGLSRALRPFAKVEPEEALSATVLAFAVFILLTAYYLLKTAREPLILLHGGAEVKSYAMAGQAALLLVVVQVYSEVARRVGRVKLLAIVYLFFAANLVVFAALARAGASIGVPFFLWVGVFNYTAIAQFWAFAADVYLPEQGKRLFAILGIGSSVGAVAGARLAKSLAVLGPAVMMLVAAVLLVVCIVLYAWVERNMRNAPRAASAPAPAPEQPLSKEGPFHLLFRDRYLLLIAALTLVLNWVQRRRGEYILDRTLLAARLRRRRSGVEPGAFVAAFKAEYFEWINVAGVVLQLFAVSRIIDRLGVRNALFVMPVFSFLGYGLILFAPVLSLIRIAKVTENSDRLLAPEHRAPGALPGHVARREVRRQDPRRHLLRARWGTCCRRSWSSSGAASGCRRRPSRRSTSCSSSSGSLTLVALGRSTAAAPPRPSSRSRWSPSTHEGSRRAPSSSRSPRSPARAPPTPSEPPRRPLPDYEGRPPPPATPGEVMLWVPRVIFSPRLLHERVPHPPTARRPHHRGRARERARGALRLLRVRPGPQGRLRAHRLRRLRLQPERRRLRVLGRRVLQGQRSAARTSRRGATTGSPAPSSSASTSTTRTACTLARVGRSRRPDQVFYGIGPQHAPVEPEPLRRGPRRRRSPSSTFPLWRVEPGADRRVGVRSVDLPRRHYDRDPGILAEVRVGRLPAARRLRERLHGADSTASPWRSTRARPYPRRRVRRAPRGRGRAGQRPEPGRGLRLDPLRGRRGRRSSTSTGTGASSASRWRRSSPTRSAAVAVPFTELVSLGRRPCPCRASTPGASSTAAPPSPRSATAGRSGRSSTARCRPRSATCSASTSTASTPGLLRFSGALGIESDSSPDSDFQFLVGFGTETFDHGGQVDSVRVVVRREPRASEGGNRMRDLGIVRAFVLAGATACGVASSGAFRSASRWRRTPICARSRCPAAWSPPRRTRST